MKFSNYGNGIVKGLTVTIRHLFRHPTVSQYPEQRLNRSRRIRGQELILDRKRCTGCATCAKQCPQGAINMVTSPDMVNNRFMVEIYEVDSGFCIQCGMCVESCPFKALFMSYSYEQSKYRRGELVQQKEDMALGQEGKQPSGYFYPDIASTLPRQTLLIEKINETKVKPGSTTKTEAKPGVKKE